MHGTTMGRFYTSMMLMLGMMSVVGCSPAEEGVVATDDDPAATVAETPPPAATIESTTETVVVAPRELAEDRTSSASALAKGDINFDDLKFDIEKGQPFEDDQLSDRVRSLNGKKVKLSGFILPASTYKQTGIERFVLVRDNQECCFGPGASLFDCVYVQMVGGNTAEFAVRPVTVEGKFKIDTESYRYPDGIGPDGSSHLAVFEIEGVEVR